jgi:hypothetical protein
MRHYLEPVEASGVPVMLDYRIYKLDAKGRVNGPALVLFCEQDEDVIRKVESLVDGYDVEILQGARVVTRLQSGGACPVQSDLQHRSAISQAVGAKA